MLTKQIIGAAIRLHRTRKGWTILDASKHSGIRQATWSDLENGKLNPTVDTLDAIAYTLQVPTSYLFDSNSILDNTLNQELGLP